MQRIWLLALAASLGCPGGGNGSKTGGGGTGPTPPLPTVEPMKVDLPPIPAKIDLTKSSPTDGNSPEKRSPILDVMKTENEREIAVLRKQKDPAYYLGYQLVEQRVVNLEAEGGALITDSDDTNRNLD